MHPRNWALDVAALTFQPILTYEIKSSHPRSPSATVSLRDARHVSLPEFPHAIITLPTKTNINQEYMKVIVRHKARNDLF